jgi:HTH-type transcriptional regulator / antitoxin HigA
LVYTTDDLRASPFDPTRFYASFNLENRRYGPSVEKVGLEPLIGTRTRVAEVLNRKRNLSIGMIRRLHETLGIPAEVLIRPTRRRKAA